VPFSVKGLGRNQHQALDAIVVGIKYKKVNWVLDADIRGYSTPTTNGCKDSSSIGLRISV
jgi:hypothetical protein